MRRAGRVPVSASTRAHRCGPASFRIRVPPARTRRGIVACDRGVRIPRRRASQAGGWPHARVARESAPTHPLPGGCLRRIGACHGRRAGERAGQPSTAPSRRSEIRSLSRIVSKFWCRYGATRCHRSKTRRVSAAARPRDAIDPSLKHHRPVSGTQLALQHGHAGISMVLRVGGALASVASNGVARRPARPVSRRRLGLGHVCTRRLQ